jgi:hypothetical protein
MVSVTLRISNEFKSKLNKLSWVNWSELARKELQDKINEEKLLEKLLKITSKSKFTEKDADELSIKIKKSMANNLKGKQ